MPPPANQLVLDASIAQASVLRYTPAGLPAIDLTLQHASQVLEAGHERQVKVEIRAVAFGATAETLARQAIGAAFRFSGFIAAARGGKHPVLHIQSFQQDQLS